MNNRQVAQPQLLLTAALIGISLWAVPTVQPAKPISLHPDNPHYFLFRGQPTVLITSGEHYGAVMNLDFDYLKYLDTLYADGLNTTRLFTGAYVEPSGAFNISRNTLAPAPNRYICAWARSDTPGYANGGNKLDLTKWNEAYFRRLNGFVSKASDRGIVVEVVLACPFYREAQWELSPFNARNNVNRLGNVSRQDVYTLTKHGGLLGVQENFVRKIVNELKNYDNVYYEICNEPYARRIPLHWEHRMVDVIVETEKSFPYQHLISRNVSNGRRGEVKIKDPHPAVSVFNFHYASPPDYTVSVNHHLNKVIGDNETGFAGTDDTHYRMEGWEFILAGGGLYNNLDYSFAVGYEDGTYEYPETQPGGGRPRLRKQLSVLKDFIHSFNFIRMRPDQSIIRRIRPEHVRVRALVETGKQYAIYLLGGPQANLTIEAPTGSYLAEWLNPLTGNVLKKETIDHTGGRFTLRSPNYEEDVALRLVRQKGS